MKKSVINCILALLLLVVTVLSVLGFRGCLSEGKGITLDGSEATVYVGESFTLTVGSENGRPMRNFSFGAEGDCVTVSADLSVTGVREGETVITFTASDGSSASCKVTVISHPESLELELYDSEGYLGDTLEIEVSATPSTAVYTYTVESSDRSVVTVEGDKLILVGEGTATVTVRADNGVTLSRDITVYPKAALSVADLRVFLYDGIETVTDLWGEPDDILKLSLESLGYVYETEKGYNIIFTDGKTVTGMYTDDPSFTFGDLFFGQTFEQVEEVIGDDFTNNHSLVTYRNEITVEVFFDFLGSGNAYSLFVGGRRCNRFVAPDLEALEGYSRAVFGLTNAYRRRLGLFEHEYFEALEEATLAHCADMIENDFVGHQSSDGRKLDERMRELDIGWHYCAENIAAGYKLPFAAFTGLINSESHRVNVVSEKYLLTGVSTLYSGDSKYGTYVTQIFCTLF